MNKMFNMVHCYEKENENIYNIALNQSAKQKDEGVLAKQSKLIHSVITENPICLKACLQEMLLMSEKISILSVENRWQVIQRTERNLQKSY